MKDFILNKLRFTNHLGILRGALKRGDDTPLSNMIFLICYLPTCKYKQMSIRWYLTTAFLQYNATSFKINSLLRFSWEIGVPCQAQEISKRLCRSNSGHIFLFNKKGVARVCLIFAKIVLKVHQCRFENLPISSFWCENNMLKISQ